MDTCLPFGLCSAPFLFNQFANVLACILQNNYGLHWLIHYLDDYFLAGPPNSTLCENHLHCFLRVCKLLGFPVALDKVEGPATILTFLGLELDSVLQQIRLPRTKLNEILEELTLWLQCRKTTKRQLFSLIGKLAFAARAVPAGRLFLRRLIRSPLAQRSDVSTTICDLIRRPKLTSSGGTHFCQLGMGLQPS